MHFNPAGLPSGIPGIGDDIETAMQHAPQLGLHSMGNRKFPASIINVVQSCNSAAFRFCRWAVVLLCHCALTIEFIHLRKYPDYAN